VGTLIVQVNSEHVYNVKDGTLLLQFCAWRSCKL